MKNVYLLQLSPDGASDFMSVLWPSAKTYYERHGCHSQRYQWINPSIEFLPDIEQIKQEILVNPPAIFGVSLYVWNVERVMPLCAWVKETFPNCVIITGGPHQYFKHHTDWFQKFPFIDASIPSEVYGELAITDLLDNLQDDNTIDWNKVERAVYPSHSRDLMFYSPKQSDRKSFDWNYSIYKSQEYEIRKYVDDYYKIKNNKLFVKLETTRGCPYSCTFCDWGGGVGTKVILKDLAHIKQDLDFLTELNIGELYICDANFGINGDRDVEVIQYIANKKRQSKDQNFISVYYGGYAKTTKHVDTIKKILTIEGENQLSLYYKISQQSFHQEVLDNVKRKDLRYDEHFKIATYMREKFDYPSNVELIMGLPGITVDLWFKEFDIPWEHDVMVRAYEWYLLPESESYSNEYRTNYDLVTAKKILSTDKYSIPMEIVVGGKTFTVDDYREMFIIYMWYLFFAQGGVYKTSINNILTKHNIKFSNFLKQFYLECYPQLQATDPESFDQIAEFVNKFTQDDIVTVFSSYTEWNNSKITIPFRSYYLMQYFKKFDQLSPILESWLIKMGATSNQCTEDSKLVITEQRLGTKCQQFLTKIDYNKYQNQQDFANCLATSYLGADKDLLVSDKHMALW
jgi:hypothetical protein